VTPIRCARATIRNSLPWCPCCCREIQPNEARVVSRFTGETFHISCPPYEWHRRRTRAFADELMEITREHRKDETKQSFIIEECSVLTMLATRDLMVTSPRGIA
jgi:hypothetical protein